MIGSVAAVHRLAGALLPAGLHLHPGAHEGPVLHLLGFHVPTGAAILLGAAALGLFLRRRLREGEPSGDRGG